jgi:hypothetical protein
MRVSASALIRRVKNFFYSLAVKDHPDIEAYIDEWSLRYYHALKPRVAVALVSFLLLLAAQGGCFVWSSVPTSVRLSLVNFIIPQTFIVGGALSVWASLNAQTGIAEIIYAAAAYVGIGVTMVIVTPFRRGLPVLTALSHVSLSVLVWSSYAGFRASLPWFLVTLHFDLFALFFQVVSYRLTKRHAQNEMVRSNLAIQNERLKVDSLERDLNVARQVQESLSGHVGDIQSCHGKVRTFQKRHDILGGDWLGVRVLDSGKLIIAVGDVSGKGIPAAMVAQVMNTLWARSLIEKQFDPVSWIGELNTTLLDLGHSEPHTASLGLAVVSDNEFTYYSAGHVPLFYRAACGDRFVYSRLVASGNLLGTNEDLELRPLKADLSHHPIDSIFLGTDGCFHRGSKMRQKEMNALVSRLETEGEDALSELPEQDDKLLIWVQRSAA